jgi:site-specific recombinase XerC
LAELHCVWTADNGLAAGASRSSAGSDKIRGVKAAAVLEEYERWLARQALADRTRSSYRRWVSELVAHLDADGELPAFFAPGGEDDRWAVLGDWRRRLLDRRLAPSTVNLALAAATSLLDSRALPAPRVRRVELDPAAPRALSVEQLRRVQLETERLRSSRDRAIMELLLRTGLRIGEVAELEVADVRLTQRTGEAVVRHGKGDRRRVVPLHRAARAALREWLVDRERRSSGLPRDRGALWISRIGQQLSVRSITKTVAKVMAGRPASMRLRTA